LNAGVICVGDLQVSLKTNAVQSASRRLRIVFGVLGSAGKCLFGVGIRRQFFCERRKKDDRLSYTSYSC